MPCVAPRRQGVGTPHTLSVPSQAMCTRLRPSGGEIYFAILAGIQGAQQSALGGLPESQRAASGGQQRAIRRQCQRAA